MSEMPESTRREYERIGREREAASREADRDYLKELLRVCAEMLAWTVAGLFFGGLAFWLATIKASKALFSAPRVFLTAATVLLAASWWARTLPAHVKWSVAAYTVFFVVAGQSFNDYWGFVAAIPYALAITYGPDGLLMLLRQAFPRRTARAA